jgi:hypothetical protein
VVLSGQIRENKKRIHGRVKPMHASHINVVAVSGT